jgi:hypothetical protein
MSNYLNQKLKHNRKIQKRIRILSYIRDNIKNLDEDDILNITESSKFIFNAATNQSETIKTYVYADEFYVNLDDLIIKLKNRLESNTQDIAYDLLHTKINL